ncbi:MAG: glycoside hydrolase family 25 protein [Lachnospiraceae bacterium]|nr:glycoside hydrolase family 25 protein [Lachnospiraceae bacterium]
MTCSFSMEAGAYQCAGAGEYMQDMNLQSKRHKRKHRRNENGIVIGSIILCLVTLTAITVCLIMVFRYRSIQMENTAVMNELEAIRMEEMVTYTQDEVDAMIANAVAENTDRTTEEVSKEFLDKLKELMLTIDGTLAMLRYFYPDEIVLADAGEYHFIPISDELAHHTYDLNKFMKDENQIMGYHDQERWIVRKGIDVSKYQDKIDWEAVASDDVEYAFIRLGIRGYTKGEILEDENFEDNIKGALRNDIDVGVYFFTQAINEEEAREEARYVLDALEPYEVNYPVVIDVEAVSNANARTKDLTVEERTQYCITFCEMIKEAGYTPMIYGNMKTFMLMLDIEQLEEYEKWVAFYDEPMYYPYAFKIWQYTDEGKVAGSTGDVDLNIRFEEVSDD